MMSRRPLTLKLPGAFMIAASLTLFGCGSNTDPGGIEGDLMIGVRGLDEEKGEPVYFLHQEGSSDSSPELIFERDAPTRAGARLRVWGERYGDTIRVQRHEFVLPEATLRQAIIGATPKALTAAIAIVDVGGGSPNLTLEKAEARMFATTETTSSKDVSLKFFYAENSFGAMDVQGESFDGVSYPMSSCDYNGLAKSVQSQITAKAGKSFSKYVYYFGTKVSACAWSGLGGGTGAWLNASIGCTVLMQEFGHAVNLPHSSTMTCAAGTPMADDPSSCTHNEYGGKHSPMGSSCYHMTAWEKWREGWLSGCNAVRVKASGSFTLHPLELPCNGVQVLQIPMAKTRPGPGSESGTQLSHYYVEMRGAYGLDSGLQPQVLVYVSNDVQVMTTGKGGGGIGNSRAWALDVNTADKSINGWGIPNGQSYTDPAGGVTISVTSISASEATINVEIAGTTVPNATGSTVCLDNTAFTPPGPAECLATPSRPGVTGGGGMLGTSGSGSGGSGGSVGGGGAAAKGGAGGTAGDQSNAGRSGGGASSGGATIAGSGGLAGVGNASGGGPNAGSAGIGVAGSSTSGAANSGGTPGSAGSPAGGFPAGGAAGASTAAGMGAIGPPPGAAGTPVSLEPSVVGEGCTCSVGPGREAASPWSLAALGLILTRWIGRRRGGRRRDPPDPRLRP